MDNYNRIKKINNYLDDFFKGNYVDKKNSELEIIKTILYPINEIPTKTTKKLLCAGLKIIRKDKRKVRYFSQIDEKIITNLYQLSIKGYQQASEESKQFRLFGPKQMNYNNRGFDLLKNLQTRYSLLSYATDFLSEWDKEDKDIKKAKKRYVCNVTFNNLKEKYIEMINENENFSLEEVKKMELDYCKDLAFTARNAESVFDINGKRLWGEKSFIINFKSYKMCKKLYDEVKQHNLKDWENKNKLIPKKAKKHIDMTKEMLNIINLKLYSNKKVHRNNHNFDMSKTMKKFWEKNNIENLLYY